MGSTQVKRDCAYSQVSVYQPAAQSSCRCHPLQQLVLYLSAEVCADGLVVTGLIADSSARQAQPHDKAVATESNQVQIDLPRRRLEVSYTCNKCGANPNSRPVESLCSSMVSSISSISFSISEQGLALAAQVVAVPGLSTPWLGRKAPSLCSVSSARFGTRSRMRLG